MADVRENDEVIWAAVSEAAASRVAEWEAAAGTHAPTRDLFSAVQGHPEGLEFTRRLIEALFGNTDAFTAAMELRELSQGELPDGMPARERLLLRAGGAVSLSLPWLVRPAARSRLLARLPDAFISRRLSGRMSSLTETLRKYHEDRNLSVLLALTGDPVHGPRGAETKIQRLIALARVPAVKHLACDPSRIVPEVTAWSIDTDVKRAAERLQPLLDVAREMHVQVLLEPSDPVWVRELAELVTRALARPELDRLELGVSLPAELPESWEAYSALHRFAERRVADGGSPLEVVIGLGDLAARERVRSIHTGLAVSVIEDPSERIAQLLRLAEIALQPKRAAVIRPVIASEDPRVVAAVIEAAEHLGAERLYGLQLRGGIAAGFADLLSGPEHTAKVRLRLPITPHDEFEGVANYLIHRIAESVSRVPHSADENAADCDSVFEDAVQLAGLPAPASHRTQQRAREWDPTERDSALFYRAPEAPATFDTGGLTAAVLGLTQGDTGALELRERQRPLAIPVVSSTGFANEPATDPSTTANRVWARDLLQRASDITTVGDGLDATIALSQADLDPGAAAAAARDAAAHWADLRHENRAVRLRRVALATAAARDRLIIELAAATGAPFPELDAAVGHIIDSARYAAQLADNLRVVRGAVYEPERLVLVVGDSTAPFAPQAAAVLAVLGSGAGALWAVSPGMLRLATAAVEEWEVGGLTPGAVRIVSVVGEHTFAALGASEHVDRAVVLGDRALGRELARRRPDLRVEGHFTARGSILVTPTAELDRAVTDIVDSAFRGRQTSLSSTQSVVLLGSMARSKDFRERLADAVRGLRAGDSARTGGVQGADPLSYDIAPLAAPPGPAALAALTELGPGEEWLVRPEQLDDSGRLWSAGVRLGVPGGSPFWDDARGLPVIGVSTAHMLGDALAHQNAVGTGAVAGIQSWDEAEVLSWLDGVEAASLSVNRPTSNPRIERQPSGGWNEAVMGLPALSGGPHWLLAQGSWERRPGQRSETLHLRGLAPEVVLLIEALQPELAYEEFDELRRAALADQLAWQTGIGTVEDVVGLGVERNLLRTVPVTVHVRLAEAGSLASLARVLAAALLVRAPLTVSTGVRLPQDLATLLDSQGIEVSLERDDDWLERLAVSGPVGPGGSTAARVRLIGGDRVRAAEWMGGLDRAALWAEPVTMAGPVELLTLLREQSISARAERHGLADTAPGVDALLEG